MIDQKQFFETYGISKEIFSKTGLKWDELQALWADYCNKLPELQAAGNMLIERLGQINEVHSLKVRIKDPDHLIEKIIRKKEKQPDRDINIETYLTNITDLIGLRALHLFKEDWVSIHHEILSIWDLHESPIAYIRKGDDERGFADQKCKIVEHPANYRSIHYLVLSKPTRNQYICEIQVRTIFEEGWSEIDHKLRYPYDINNEILAGYLAIFNRLAGNADEMGSYIKHLKAGIQQMKNDLEDNKAEKDKIIQELENISKKLKAESEENKRLQGVIKSLSKSKPTATSLDWLTSAQNSLGTPLDVFRNATKPSQDISAFSTPLIGRTCKHCHKVQPITIAATIYCQFCKSIL